MSGDFRGFHLNALRAARFSRLEKAVSDTLVGSARPLSLFIFVRLRRPPACWRIQIGRPSRTWPDPYAMGVSIDFEDLTSHLPRVFEPKVRARKLDDSEFELVLRTICQQCSCRKNPRAGSSGAHGSFNRGCVEISSEHIVWER